MPSREDSVRRRRDRGAVGQRTGKVGACSTRSASRSSSRRPGSSRSSGRGRVRSALTVCRRRWQIASAIASGRKSIEPLRGALRLAHSYPAGRIGPRQNRTTPVAADLRWLSRAAATDRASPPAKRVFLRPSPALARPLARDARHRRASASFPRSPSPTLRAHVG